MRISSIKNLRFDTANKYGFEIQENAREIASTSQRSRR